jgi:phage tail-like protein
VLPPPPEMPGALTEPFDLAPLDDGGVAVLDRAHKLIWVLDASLRLVTDPTTASSEALLFQPKEGAERAETTPARSQPISLADCNDPVSLVPLPDSTFLVLDQRGTEASVIWRFWRDPAVSPQHVELLEENLRAPDEPSFELPAIRGHDMALVVGGDGAGTLYITDTGGNQAFALRVLLESELTLRARRDYYPLRSYTGKALLAPSGEPHPFYDQGERWLPVKALPRTSFEREATLVLRPLDGKEPGCVWHRLCLDACLPPDTDVQIETRAADDTDDLQWLPWQPEPAPYLRHAGAELPFYQLWSEEALRNPGTGTWELLFQQARGRYLEIRLTLRGNTRTTPHLRALRAYYPRFSYLKQYLPAVYREDAESAQFLDSFLANPEGVFTTLEGQIAQVQALFDVRSAPSDALDWLAGWIGLALDPAWTDYQRRLLLAHADYFYRRRGTKPGVLQAILLAIKPELGPAIFQDDVEGIASEVRIVERFRTRTRPAATLGDPTGDDATTGDRLEEARLRAHSFTVLLPAGTSAEQVNLVERIVKLEKPAHTTFTVKQYWAMFRVGEARLGLDSALGRGGRFDTLRIGATALAGGVLGAAYPFNLPDRTVIAHKAGGK